MTAAASSVQLFVPLRTGFQAGGNVVGHDFEDATDGVASFSTLSTFFMRLVAVLFVQLNRIDLLLTISDRIPRHSSSASANASTGQDVARPRHSVPEAQFARAPTATRAARFRGLLQYIASLESLVFQRAVVVARRSTALRLVVALGNWQTTPASSSLFEQVAMGSRWSFWWWMLICAPCHLISSYGCCVCSLVAVAIDPVKKSQVDAQARREYPKERTKRLRLRDSPGGGSNAT